MHLEKWIYDITPTPDTIPIQITVESGSYIIQDNFTYISTSKEDKTFPIDTVIELGIYRIQIELNRLTYMCMS